MVSLFYEELKQNFSTWKELEKNVYIHYMNTIKI